mgnify:CR=1 FL=1
MINGLELYHLSLVTCHLSLVTNKKLGNFFCLLSFFVLPLPPKTRSEEQRVIRRELFYSLTTSIVMSTLWLYFLLLPLK